MANPIQAAAEQLLEAGQIVEAQGQQPRRPPVPVNTAVPKALSSNIVSIRQSSINQDPILAALGGSYVVSDNNIQTIAAAEEFFDPSLLNLGSTTTTDDLGTKTSETLVQAIDPSLDLRSMTGASVRHSAYNIPFAPVATAAAKYNFYAIDYENFLDSQTGDVELSMLDVYGTVLSSGQSPELNSEDTRLDSSGLPHARRFTFTATDRSRENVEKYFNTYGIDEVAQESKYKNVIYPWKNITDANSAFALAKGSFPFYISFDIGMAPNGRITQALMNSEYADNLVYNLAAAIDAGQVFTRTRYLQQKFDDIRYSDSREFPMNDILSYRNEAFMNNSIFLGTDEEKKESYPWVEPTFDRNLEALQLLVDIKNTIADFSKGYQQISQGEKNYSEVLAYRIAKFDANDMDSPVQNFYFFNSVDSDTFNFVDSQTVPGKLYKYKVYAYTFVCEEFYTYEDITLADPVYTLKVKSTPDATVVESMIYETDGFVTSQPPICPEVDFRSFLGNERRIAIYLQQSAEQRRTEQPVAFNYEESQRNQLLRESQGVPPNSPLSFVNDDSVVVYEVYRTTTPPEKVGDFADKLWRRVVDSNILESVRPDTTYYYIFRSIDGHGNVSNPTQPYEVTLIGGVSPYLIVTPYTYAEDEIEKKQRAKSFKRFLRIAPSLPQLMINQETVANRANSLDVSRAKLGVADEGVVWGKKYKIRITSKETGKKIDFNLEYDYNFERREQ